MYVVYCNILMKPILFRDFFLFKIYDLTFYWGIIYLMRTAKLNYFKNSIVNQLLLQHALKLKAVEILEWFSNKPTFRFLSSSQLGFSFCIALLRSI